MKRKTILTTIAVMILVGCGSDNHEVENQVEQDAETKVEAKEEIVVDSGEITKEKLMSMNANPASDFDVYLDEEANEYVITDYLGESDIVVIPDSIDGTPVGKIKRMAFANNNRGGTSIKAVRLPDSLHTVGENAFANCSDLEIFLPGSGLKVLEVGALVGVNNLQQFDFPAGMEVLGSASLSMFIGWKNIYLPSSLQEIGVLPGESYIVEEGSYAHEYINNMDGVTFTFK